jgi:hypothetical protein
LPQLVILLGNPHDTTALIIQGDKCTDKFPVFIVVNKDQAAYVVTESNGAINLVSLDRHREHGALGIKSKGVVMLCWKLGVPDIYILVYLHPQLFKDSH